MPPAARDSAPAPTLADGATETHPDDSYCALCRRCQMRKKLERRLAAKNEKGPSAASVSCAPGTAPSHSSAARLTAHAHSHPLNGSGLGGCHPDDMPVDELMLFIGGGAHGSAGGPRPRRKRRAKKANGSHISGVEKGDCVPLNVGQVPEIEANEAADEERVDGARLGTKAAQINAMDSPVSDEGVEVDDRVTAPSVSSKACVDGMCCSTVDGLLGVDFTEEDMSPEELQAIDQEVEAFRLSLEACAQPSGHPV